MILCFILHTEQEFTATCLKELELKKKQEVGNISHIEQAVNDLKVKWKLAY